MGEGESVLNNLYNKIYLFYTLSLSMQAIERNSHGWKFAFVL